MEHKKVSFSLIHLFVGNLPLVYMLTSLGVDIHTTDPDHGATPLHWAAFKGHHDVCELLIQRGADVNAKTSDEDQQTAFSWACMSGDLKVVKLFVENDAKLDEQCGRGYTPIMNATQYGFLHVVHYLYKAGASLDIKVIFFKSQITFRIKKIIPLFIGLHTGDTLLY